MWRGCVATDVLGLEKGWWGMVCPDCNGVKTSRAAFVDYADGTAGYDVAIKCDRCVGTGQVDDRMPEWIAKGKLLRESRMNPHRPMYVEAKRRMVSAMTLSQMERGVCEPMDVLPYERKDG